MDGKLKDPANMAAEAESKDATVPASPVSAVVTETPDTAAGQDPGTGGATDERFDSA